MDAKATREEIAKAKGAAPADTATAPSVPVTTTPPPHRPPVPVKSSRLTMLGGMLGAPLPAPAPVADDDAIEACFQALCDKARKAGLAVGHCHNGAEGCEEGDAAPPTPAGIASAKWRAVGTVDSCMCNCEGCRRIAAYALQAQRTVLGPRFK